MTDKTQRTIYQEALAQALINRHHLHVAGTSGIGSAYRQYLDDTERAYTRAFMMLSACGVTTRRAREMADDVLRRLAMGEYVNAEAWARDYRKPEQAAG